MSVFDEGLNQLALDPGDTPPGVFSIIADRLEEAICGDEQELRLLAEKLDTILRAGLRNNGAIAPAILGQEPDSKIETAYALGRLSFALELAQRTLSRRPPEGFYTMLDDYGWSGFYKALLKQGRVSLSSRLGEKATKKRRKEELERFQVLVNSGVVDFVEENGDTLFMLTPAARSYLENKPPLTLGLPEELLAGWGDLDSAINRVITSLPAQISANMEDLEGRKRTFRELIHKLAMGR
ncbi:hypothetical protein CcrColossus_gp308 [Caulobacter phage CcrColossus]|uniref:Uncharacterized protein n=1 Tax=Caulobacter phage CcrColossus TaxID=1211640 RepID=K4JW99_9CAUD|nr:hypothetical protein CcrColossus_gp308 [Caulobacter phage CcrColossus]AFU88178.1 hypothetical protein CcrColossus_gp308 [Caulobacter phage CcrColossus]